MEETMKPFNLEEFKSGKKAVTRVGQTATFGGYNKDANEYFQILGWIDGENYGWKSDGSYDDHTSDFDLIGMAPEKKTVWVNVWKSPYPQVNPAQLSNAYHTKEDAEICSRGGGDSYIGTYPLEIEV